jgi:uncharacterized protein
VSLKTPRPLRLRIASWLRWLHIYLSMFSLLVVLFFSVTGLTLNHPEWLSGASKQSDTTGQLSADWVHAPGEVKKLEVVERLRSQYGVHGAMDEFRIDETQCVVSFQGPGYAADATIDRSTGALQLHSNTDGNVAIANDLHKGRHTGKRWAWVIDVSAVFLTLISLTGLGLMFYLKRLRVAGLLTALAGIILFFLLLRLVP